MASLELVDKQKNAFGDTVYYIRDPKGGVSLVFEDDLEGFLRKHGVQSLKQGKPYLYPRNKK